MVSNHNITIGFKKAAAYAHSRGMFRGRDFEDAGFYREYLRRLVEAGEVRQLSRGLYAASNYDADQNSSLIEAARKMPRGVVCLGSALQFHEIGTQSAHQVWLAVPRSTNFPRTKTRMRFCKFSDEAHSFGIQTYKISGGTIHVYSPAKTVADCFKYRNKYGLDIAVEGLREGWREKKFTMNELLKAAEVCRVRNVIQPYIEMLV